MYVASLLFLLCATQLVSSGPVLNYNAAITRGNPLRGYMAFIGEHGRFPHSMENFFISMKEIMINMNVFDWQILDAQLNAIGSRKHQAYFTVYVDYPGGKSGRQAIPDFLTDNGLKLLPYDGGFDPDYNDERFISAIENLIQAMGQRYDGDPRVGFMGAGFFGRFGEWHTFGYDERFPGPLIQNRIINTYSRSFKKTKILYRYPKRIGTYKPMDLGCGFYDGSFAYSSDGFIRELAESGGAELYKKAAIAGELRPETAGCVFTDGGCTNIPYQDITQAVKDTKLSFLANHGAFAADPPYSGSRLNRAKDLVDIMGYQFFVESISVATVGSFSTVTIQMKNNGVAPFYYPLSLNLREGNRNFVATDQLHTLLPSAPVQFRARLSGVSGKTVFLRMSSLILHPDQVMSFANDEADRDGSIVFNIDPNPAPARWDILGCFADQEPRSMTKTAIFSDGAMNYELCASHCASNGARFMGLEYGVECHCSDTLPPIRSPAGECTSTCGGDGSKTCGGGWRLTVVSLVPQINRQVVSAGFNRRGCYQDQADRSMSKVNVFSDGSMTYKKCAQYCASHDALFMGLEYGWECYCSDRLPPQKIADSQCNSQCPGDLTTLCGGYWTLTVLDVPSRFPINYKVVGCYEDGSTRQMNKVPSISNWGMTYDICSEYCAASGALYMGLQDGSQCFCSDQIPPVSKPNECNTPCRGDPSKNCGGAWRLTVINVPALLRRKTTQIFSGATDQEEIGEGTQPTTTIESIQSTSTSTKSIQTSSSTTHEHSIPGWSVALLTLSSVIVFLFFVILLLVLRR